MLSFRPLEMADFPLLLKWLEAAHVKKFWDSEIHYSLASIQKKYADYVHGFKIHQGQKKTIQAYIISSDEQPIGYIQLYNPYDFELSSENLPSNLGAIDFYIGEESFLHQGIASRALSTFLNEYAFQKYRYLFVNPLIVNERAVRCFLKAGFKVYKKHHGEFWMIAFRRDFRLSTLEAIALENAFKNAFLSQDHLFIFGSRANLNQAGGDIDLYIETHAKSIEIAVAMQDSFINALYKNMVE